MPTIELDKLRFPIGIFVKPESVSPEEIKEAINRIESFSSRLRKEVGSLNDAQLDTPYRPDGWTVRQVVHHCADSHMNALIRFKLTLTENGTTIKPYPENLFAELPDYKLPVEASLEMLDGIQSRLGAIIRNMKPSEFANYYVHPQYGTHYRLDQATMLYAWHCDHHLAHITSLKQREQWT